VSAGDLRALAAPPAGVALLLDPSLGLADDQPLTVVFELSNDTVRRISVGPASAGEDAASDDEEGGYGGYATTVTTTFVDLGLPVEVEVPADAEALAG
jgi:hypothetical protein